MFLPLLHKLDLSVTQDVFKNIKGKRNAGQFRIDIQNFGNLLNSNWGVGQRVIRNNILTTPAADASGRLSYRMQVVNNQLVSKTFESTSGTAGRLPVHAQLPVFVQLTGLQAQRAYGLRQRQAGGSKTTRPFSFCALYFLL